MLADSAMVARLPSWESCLGIPLEELFCSAPLKSDWPCLRYCWGLNLFSYCSTKAASRYQSRDALCYPLPGSACWPWVCVCRRGQCSELIYPHVLNLLRSVFSRHPSCLTRWSPLGNISALAVPSSSFFRLGQLTYLLASSKVQWFAGEIF